MQDDVQHTAAALGLGCDAGLPQGQRVTVANWRTPPFNRYALQRVQQFTRTARVPRSIEPASLPAAHTDIGDVAYVAPDGEQRRFADMVARTWTDGVLLIHRGNIIHEQYLNGMQPETLHIMFSCSKSMTSTLAGVLVHDGTLRLNSLCKPCCPSSKAPHWPVRGCRICSTCVSA